MLRVGAPSSPRQRLYFSWREFTIGGPPALTGGDSPLIPPPFPRSEPPFPGPVAEWLCRGLQIPVHRFDSGPGLQPTSSNNRRMRRPTARSSCRPLGLALAGPVTHPLGHRCRRPCRPRSCPRRARRLPRPRFRPRLLRLRRRAPPSFRRPTIRRSTIRRWWSRRSTIRRLLTRSRRRNRLSRSNPTRSLTSQVVRPLRPPRFRDPPRERPGKPRGR